MENVSYGAQLGNRAFDKEVNAPIVKGNDPSFILSILALVLTPTMAFGIVFASIALCVSLTESAGKKLTKKTVATRVLCILAYAMSLILMFSRAFA